MKVCIIGAGVIGLSTAQSIYQHFHGRVTPLTIEVYADVFTPLTTSDGAAGLWQPYLYDKGNVQETWGFIWLNPKVHMKHLKHTLMFSEMLYNLVDNQMFLFYFHSKWNKETFDYLQSFLSSPDSVKMGIFLQSGYDLCTETVPVRSFSFPSLKCLIFKMYSSVKFNVAHVACRWYVIERKQC